VKTADTEKQSNNYTETSKATATPISTNITTTAISPAVAISKAVGPSVVGITTTVTTTDFFNRAYNQEASGSGIIFDSTDDKVYIVTNNHVIEGATKVVVTLLGDQKVEAKLVGTDTQTDLAVITVDKSSLNKESVNNIVVAKFGDSSAVQVGELSIAIGNPLGEQFSNSVTQGVISGVNRKIQVEDRNLTMLQTDAAINPGNSGGALVNSKGEVIGINTVKYTDSTVEGMGFAIPTNIAKPIIEELRNKGYISRPYLGILGTNVTEEYSQVYALPVGVYVSQVTSGGGADNAGIKAGDVITEFNGDKITSMEQLTQLIKQQAVGEKVTIRVIRNGKTAKDFNVVLQDSQAQTTQTQQTQKSKKSQQQYSLPFGQ
jgi:serine protease Do